MHALAHLVEHIHIHFYKPKSICKALSKSQCGIGYMRIMCQNYWLLVTAYMHANPNLRIQ